MFGKESPIYVDCSSEILGRKYEEYNKNIYISHSERVTQAVYALGCVGVSYVLRKDRHKRTYYFETENDKIQFLLEYT